MNREELLSILKNAETIEDIDRYRDELVSLIPYISCMFGYKQNNHFHQYDLWTHTLHVIVRMGRNSDEMVYLAALLHDIGKPEARCAGRRKDDRESHYYGHPAVSKRIVREIVLPSLAKHGIDFTQDEQERLLFYVEHHDDALPEKENKQEKLVENYPQFLLKNWMKLEKADAEAHIIYPIVLKRICLAEALLGMCGKEK